MTDGIAAQEPLTINPEYEYAARYNSFRLALTAIINQHSIENGSDTPDFLLAEFLTECLQAWDRSVQAREEWFGRKVSDWADGVIDHD